MPPVTYAGAGGVVSAPAAPFDIDLPDPLGEPRSSALTVAAAAVTEQLASLASQAEQWRRALLRTSSEIVSLSDACTQVGGEEGEQGPASGPAAVDLLSGLLHGGSQATWLHTGAVDSSALERIARSAELPPPRGTRVRALVAMPLATATGGSSEDLWRDYSAEIRVADRAAVPPRDLIIVDRRLVAVAWRSNDDRLRAETVTEPTTAVMLGSLWDLLWAQALPLEAAVRLEELAGDEVKRDIVEQLSAGAKDEVIARALGISLRTCRRHIAEILAAAGAISRFQAGALLARAGVFGSPLD
jgi:DNA-binding CsgD family transcriptional regulator